LDSQGLVYRQFGQHFTSRRARRGSSSQRATYLNRPDALRALQPPAAGF